MKKVYITKLGITSIFLSLFKIDLALSLVKLLTEITLSDKFIVSLKFLIFYTLDFEALLLLIITVTSENLKYFL